MGVVARVRKATRVLFGYDSSTTTPENQRHWSNVKRDQNPIEKNQRQTRTTIRDRARDEHDNNSYLQGMVATHSKQLLGPTGPQLQLLTPDSKFNSAIEQQYKQWGEHPYVNLPNKLSLLEQGRLIEGEGFWNFTDDDDLKKETGFSFNVNPIASRRVTDPDRLFLNYVKIDEGQYNDDGVIYDTKTGRPLSYNVVSVAEELTSLLKTKNIGTRVDASSMRHWFTPKEIGQTRGVSEVQAALALFAYLRRFTLATVSTAEIIACMTAFLKTTQPPEEQAPVPPWQQMEIVRGMLQSLPDGYEPVQLEQKHPSSTYEMFVNLVLREIGRVLNMPFGIVAGDCSKYNYSSARLDFLDYQETLKFFRTQLSIIILNPTFTMWAKERAKIDTRLRGYMDAGTFKFTWQFPTRPSINPLMDAQAEEIRLLNGSTTLAEVYGDRGKNWEEELEQRKKEVDKMKELELSFAGMPVAEEIPEEETSNETEEELSQVA